MASWTGLKLLRALRKKGCDPIRRESSHVRVMCEDGCQTTIPIHKGEDLPKGTLGQIQRDLARCLGDKWLSSL